MLAGKATQEQAGSIFRVLCYATCQEKRHEFDAWGGRRIGISVISSSNLRRSIGYRRSISIECLCCSRATFDPSIRET
jgi:hypothetical protein